MKIGVVLPQTEIGNDPAAIKAFAEAVEEMGFTHILVFDMCWAPIPIAPGAGKAPTRTGTASTNRSCSSGSWPRPRAGSSW